MPCGSTVQWWELDMTAHCRLPVGHNGHHYDGLWWFDGNGLRVDGTAHEWKPNSQCPGECPEVRDAAQSSAADPPRPRARSPRRLEATARPSGGNGPTAAIQLCLRAANNVAHNNDNPRFGGTFLPSPRRVTGSNLNHTPG